MRIFRPRTIYELWTYKDWCNLHDYGEDNAPDGMHEKWLRHLSFFGKPIRVTITKGGFLFGEAANGK